MRESRSVPCHSTWGHAMRQRSLLLLSVWALLASTGSYGQDQDTAPAGGDEAGTVSATERALGALSSAYNDLTSRAGQGSGEAVDWAQSDIENLGDWEYRIVEFDGLTSSELEAELNQLGNERWEAYWVQGSGDAITVFMKRQPISYLSRVPLSTLLRLLAGGAQ